MSKITDEPGVDKIKEPAEQIRFIATFLDSIKSLLNNGLGLVDNFAGKNVSATFSVANTDTALVHGLGRVPTGYIVSRRSASMNVYDGATAWTSNVIYLKSSATGTATIFVY